MNAKELKERYTCIDLASAMGLLIEKESSEYLQFKSPLSQSQKTGTLQIYTKISFDYQLKSKNYD